MRVEAKQSEHGPRLKNWYLPKDLLVISSALVSVCALTWILWYCRYGVDFTDEGFYLNWISNPFIYPLSHTQFGFVYYPLYKLLDGNIVSLRQANILILFGLGWVLTYTFCKTILTSLPLTGWRCAVITSSFAVLVFSHFNNYLWLPTPNYNSLALKSLMITATGLLLMERDGSRENLAGCLLLGVGVWLAFMAKPTTAVALGLCSIVYFFAVRKLTIRFLSILGGVSAILFTGSALLIDGSLVDFIKRLVRGAETLWLLESDHRYVLRYDELHFGRHLSAVLAASVTVFYIGASLLGSRSRVAVYCSTILSMLLPFFSLAIISGFLHVNLVQDPELGFGAQQGLILWAIPLTAFLIGLSSRKFRGVFSISRRQCARVFIFLALPAAYAIGTAANYWSKSIDAGIFLVLAGFFIVVPAMNHERLKYMVIFLALASQMTTVVLVDYAMEHPYRQPHPLHENNYPVDFGEAGSTLILARSSEQYVSEAMDLAERAFFSHGTPIIDLTGRSPGLLYALGAKSVGRPWLLGEHPGSNRFVADALKRVACEELAVAWLLTAPGDPRRISAEVLSGFGADPDRDYKVVGVLSPLENPIENGGDGVGYPRYAQQLLKPVRSTEAMTAACIRSRGGRIQR